ncbi:MAG: hypothetical protein NT027_10195 [Proteobacteria bacterium]|nr:hypothetical protein [Pseudomonadota bacterium]
MSTLHIVHKRIAKHSTGWTASKKLTKAVSIIGLLMVTSCTDTFMKTKAVNQRALTADLAATADSAGNYSATIDPNSNATQRFKAGAGSVYGAAIALPVGALSIPISITIGEGESLTSSTQQIGLSSDNPATAASSSVSFVPSSAVEAANPFTLSIPISITTSLGLAEAASNENLVVLYKWMAVKAGVTSYEIGLIPRKDITMASGTAQFQTTKFGTFQLVRTAVKVEEKIKKPTDEPPILKADAGNPLVGSWGSCENKSFGQNNGNGGGSGLMDEFGPVELACSRKSSTVPIRINLQPGFSHNFTAEYQAKSITVTRTTPGSVNSLTSTISLSSVQGKETIEFIPPTSGGTTIDYNESILLTAPDGCYFDDQGIIGSRKLRTIAYRNPDFDWTGTIAMAHSNTYTDSSLYNYLVSPGHNLNNNDLISFIYSPPGSSTAQNYVYWVCNADSDKFQISTTSTVSTCSPQNISTSPSSQFPVSFIRPEARIYHGTLRDASTLAKIESTETGIIQNGMTIIFTSVQDSNASSNVKPGIPYYVADTYNGGTPYYFKLSPDNTASRVSSNATNDVTVTFYIATKVTNGGTAMFQTKHIVPEIPYSNGIPLIFTKYFPDGLLNTLPELGKLYPTTANASAVDNPFIGTPGTPGTILDARAGFAALRRADCLPKSYPQMKLVCDGTKHDTSGSNNNQNSDAKRSLGIGPGITPKSQSEFVKFSPNTFIHGNASFFGENCTGGLISRTEETGTYSLGAKNSDSTQAITINMMTLKAAIFPPQAVNNANSISKTAGCGASDWVSAQPKDLNTTECKETPEQSSNNVPKVFRIKDGQLNFQEADGTYKPSKELKRAK